MFRSTLLQQYQHEWQTYNHTLRRRPKTNLTSFIVNCREATLVPPTNANSIFDTVSIMISLKAK